MFKWILIGSVALLGLTACGGEVEQSAPRPAATAQPVAPDLQTIDQEQIDAIEREMEALYNERAAKGGTPEMGIQDSDCSAGLGQPNRPGTTFVCATFYRGQPDWGLSIKATILADGGVWWEPIAWGEG